MAGTSDAIFALHRNRAKRSKNGDSFVFSLKNYLEQVHREENVTAVVVATYRLSLPAIIKEYPTLFDDTKPINLLLLHGEKGMAKNIVLSEAREELLHCKRNRSLEIWEVIPQLSQPNSRKIVYAKGVHHPKYMLLFSDKGLHVVITTANFNGSECTDGIWHGFFPFLPNNEMTMSVDSSNDFGIVLQDFIERQSEQLSRVEEFSSSLFSQRCIIDWIEKYAGVRSLRDQFDFSSASNIKLVSTVPSRQPLPVLSSKEGDFLRSQSSFDMDMQRLVPCESCLQEQELLDEDDHISYGSRRVSQLLRKENFSLNNNLGKLLIQQTSIGLSINNSFMNMLLQDLMPESDWEENSPSAFGRREDNYEIIWPTLIHMNNIKRYYQLNPPAYRRLSKDKEKPLSQISSVSSTLTQDSLNKDGSLSLRRTQESDFQDEDSDEEDAVKEERERRKGILFFQPSFYATMEPDIHSQFYTYESWPQPKGLFAPCRYLVPHIKSYCRLLNGTPSRSSSGAYLGSSEKKKRRQFSFQSTPSDDCLQDNPPGSSRKNDNCSCPKLAWLLLTSACLSRGAQGRIVPYSICDCCGHIRRGYYEYRNFELGVLFQSSHDRQYVAVSPTCVMHQALVCRSSTSSSTTETPSSPAKNPYSQQKLYIPLPVPFQVHDSLPYCDSRQSLMVCPYFHHPNEIRKYISEFRNRDPLFCHYPTLSNINNSKTNVLSTLQSFPSLPFSGRKRRFSRTDEDDEQKLRAGICNGLARAETISAFTSGVTRRRQFVLPPTHNLELQEKGDNTNSTWKRASTTSSAVNVCAANVEISDSYHTYPLLGDSDIKKMVTQINISSHKSLKSQRASYPPDKFSTSKDQLISMSQTEEMLCFQREVSLTEDKENSYVEGNMEEFVEMDLSDDHRFVFQSTPQENETNIHSSTQKSHLSTTEYPDYYLKSKLTKAVLRSDSECGVEQKSIIAEVEQLKFSLQQEISESGEILYKLVRS